MTPEELFEQNQNLVYFVLNKWFKPLSQDEDMRQTAMLEFWRACSTYTHTKVAFTTYAVKCVKNRLVTHLQVPKKKQAVLLSLDQPAYRTSNGLSTSTISDTIVDQSQYIRDSEDIFSKFNDRQKRIAKMRIYGFTMSEIGANIGVSQQMIGAELKRMRRLIDA